MHRFPTTGFVGHACVYSPLRALLPEDVSDAFECGIAVGVVCVTISFIRRNNHR